MMIHWHADMHMAPLLIRYAAPSATSVYQRTLVVQLAPILSAKGAPQKRVVDEVEGGVRLARVSNLKSSSPATSHAPRSTLIW